MKVEAFNTTNGDTPSDAGILVVMKNTTVLSLVAKAKTGDDIWTRPTLVMSLANEKNVSEPINGISHVSFDPIFWSTFAVASRYGNGNFSGIAYQGPGTNKWTEGMTWDPYPKSRPQDFKVEDRGYPAVTGQCMILQALPVFLNHTP